MKFNGSIILALLAAGSASAFVVPNFPASAVSKNKVARAFISQQSSFQLFSEVSDTTDEVAAVEETVVEVESAEPVVEEAAPPAMVEPESFSIYVGNLPFETEESVLSEVFGTHGTVNKVTVPTDRNTGKGRGFAFIEMSSKAELEAACAALNETDMGGRKLSVYESLPKGQKREKPVRPAIEGTKIYVGNLNFDTTKETIMDTYSEYGEVKDVYVPINPETGMPRGFAFVTMSVEDAPKAIEGTDGVNLDGRTLTVSVSLPPGEKKPPRKPFLNKPQTTKLYVGNLSFYTTLDELREIFEDYGEVIDCYMPEDRETGRSRGFAFVQMEPEPAQQAAEECDGFELDGRILRVNEAQPKGYSNRQNDNNEGSWDEGSNDASDAASDGGSWDSNDGY